MTRDEAKAIIDEARRAATAREQLRLRGRYCALLLGGGPVVTYEKLQEDSIAAALARLEAAYDSATEQEKVADAAREVAGPLSAPSWWKEATARFSKAKAVGTEPHLLPRVKA